MTKASAEPDSTVNSHAARRLSRLAAVQALYQMALTGIAVEDLIRNFHADPGALLTEDAPAAVDMELFDLIVSGVAKHMDDVDGMIAGGIDQRLSAERLEPLLRAVMRAGVYELHHNTTVPAGVIINDYVDVAHAFYDGKEPGLVNAILDRLGKVLRT
jgi:N utilization substance protein B